MKPIAFLLIAFALMLLRAEAQDSTAPSAAKKTPASPAVAATKTNGEAVATQIYADEASFDTEKRIGIFSGHVRVFDPRFNIQSDKLTVYIHKEEGEGLERAIAGDTMRFNTTTKLGMLKGNVHMTLYNQKEIAGAAAKP